MVLWGGGLRGVRGGRGRARGPSLTCVQVVEACEAAGLSNRAFKLRPIAVIKG